MPSTNTVGIAPLVCGLVLLAGTVTRATGGADGTLTTYALVAQLFGGGAAVIVGVGILLDWGSFGAESADTDSSVGRALAAEDASTLLPLAAVVAATTWFLGPAADTTVRLANTVLSGVLAFLVAAVGLAAFAD